MLPQNSAYQYISHRTKIAVQVGMNMPAISMIDHVLNLNDGFQITDHVMGLFITL